MSEHDDYNDLQAIEKLGTALDIEADVLPPLEIKEPPGFLRFMPPVIKEIASLGATFKMEQDGTLQIEGFYKNGPMKIDFEKDVIVAIDRRGRKKIISSFDDLVVLNFAWWRMSNTKTNYIMPERPWLDQFITKKWVKRKVIFEPMDDVAEGASDE